MRLRRDGVLIGKDRVLCDGGRAKPGPVHLGGQGLVTCTGAGLWSQAGDTFRIGGVDSGDDGEVVLVFPKVLVGGGIGVVERVDEGWIEWAEAELVHLVGEVEVVVIKMLAELNVAVSTSHDVEVALDFVQLQRAIYPA